jgi:hypothetical protein
MSAIFLSGNPYRKTPLGTFLRGVKVKGKVCPITGPEGE